MKFKTLTVAALTILSISQGVSAKGKVYIGTPTWTKDKYVYSENNGKALLAELDFSVGRVKSIYFSRYKMFGGKTSNICTHENDDGKDGFINVNGVNVSVYVFCKRDESVNALYQSITPATRRGLNYVMGQFSKNVKPIKVNVFGDDFLLKTIGFNKTSKELGSNPI